jgi:hypothetical protein
MNDDDDIKALIAEWQTLRIRADAIVRQLEAANARRTIVDTVTSATTADDCDLTVNGLRKGDRVRIKNKVTKPATWPIEKPWHHEEARLATITRVTKEQMHFRTDDGVSTWRAPNNLERIK